MEKVRILAVDPSLRNTGLAVLTYNCELAPNDEKAFEVSHCQVVTNPQKYTGVDAILNMLDLLKKESEKECYQNIDTVLVESPPIMFNKAWAAGTVSLIAHVAGGAVAIFGIEKGFLFRPNEWNKSRKKEVTHNKTIAFLGHPDKWHYETRLKSEKYLEHILDASSMALWYVKANYIEED